MIAAAASAAQGAAGSYAPPDAPSPLRTAASPPPTASQPPKARKKAAKKWKARPPLISEVLSAAGAAGVEVDTTAAVLQAGSRKGKCPYLEPHPTAPVPQLAPSSLLSFLCGVQLTSQRYKRRNQFLDSIRPQQQ